MQCVALRSESGQRVEAPRDALRLSPVAVVDREDLKSRPEDSVLAFLNELLESTRAAARAAEELAKTHPASVTSRQLRAIGNAQAVLCVDLWREIEARGGEASNATGPLYGLVCAQRRVGRQLALLLEGQLGIARRIREVVPKIASRHSRTRLFRILGKQERAAACTRRVTW